MENIRQITENNERLILSDKAMLCVNSAGRKIPENKCELRTEFQRDRDRIIHSRSFRRLKHKTQVFLSPELDHYRTRLTHTLEVAQIARTLSRALRLNEDLTEAIALGHDLGHTPFGHAGERAINDLVGFEFTHYEQSVRVCERLEKNGKGLNLTFEVLDGILRHTKGQWADTLEGRIVRFSDRIAYINHDIEDAIRAGVVMESDIPKEITNVLGNTKSQRINTLVKSIVENSADDIRMDSETEKYYNLLHEFLFDAVYKNPVAKSEETKVLGIVEGLFNYFVKNPDKMSPEYLVICEKDGVERAVADYIAGMTDHYAITTYSNIYIPKAWTI
ncbi:MAG: deoxyguanosinetriphosphate triphosphohydrolase [Ruminococcaceae bacterium]|nr:deoxyguanosinetriphosphate triphosphohydrolase [Oscillospiraceae bacterium]